jgi:hypothetical protein
MQSRRSNCVRIDEGSDELPENYRVASRSIAGSHLMSETGFNIFVVTFGIVLPIGIIALGVCMVR